MAKIPWLQIAKVARERGKAAGDRAREFTAAGEPDIANMWLIHADQMIFEGFVPEI